MTTWNEIAVPGQITNVVVDWRDLGKASAETLSKAMGDTGKVLAIDFREGFARTDLRRLGFEQELKGHKNIEYVGVGGFTGTDVSQAAKIVTVRLQQDPDLTGIFATNIYAAQGVVDALRKLQKTHEVFLATAAELTPLLAQWVRTGQMLAATAPNGPALETLAARIALQWAEGRRNFADRMMPENRYLVVTKNNVDSLAVKAITIPSNFRCKIK